MYLQELAPELVHTLYNSLTSVSDVINLAATCRRLHHLLSPARRLPALFTAAEHEIGPLEDIAQLVTYNDARPAYTKRTPVRSLALLQQMVKIGRTAQAVVDVYPSWRWRSDYLHRRALSVIEQRSVRRAVYRYWLYCEAHHCRNATRFSRMLPQVVEERARLLRLWTTQELIELCDIQAVFEDIIALDLCPTDGAAAKSMFHDPYHTTQYGAHSWPPSRHGSTLQFSSFFHSSHDDFDYELNHSKHCSLPIAEQRKLEMTGWGDDINQYYIVQAMLKLNPAQLMRLYSSATLKSQVQLFVATLGEEWFWDNGQTFLDTWCVVLAQRGIDWEKVRDQLAQGVAGIALNIADV